MADVLPPGTEVNGRYTLRQPLGNGQSAVVYEAWDEYLHRLVALKLLEPSSSGPATWWHESRTLEQLRSEFLLPVLNADVVTETDLRYITTPIMTNGDLTSTAQHTGVPASRAVAWGVQMAHALERVHGAKLLHRDVKPGNVFINDDGSILVGDLGKAAAFTPATPAERDGTWETLAPEAAASDGHCTVATDVYSLGATVFYLLAGCYQIDENQDAAAKQAQIVNGKRRKLLDVAPHVSRSLRTIVERAMSMQPELRFESPLEFGNALASASLYARDWQRVIHPSHVLCLEGQSTSTAKAVSVCSVPTGAVIGIQARLPSGRRAPGVDDVAVPGKDLAREIRNLTARLG